jgi:hypothetical protein
MNSKLTLHNSEYFLDFVYAKIKQIWPQAVLVDEEADQRLCKGLKPKDYGYDIYRSTDDLEALFTGECYDPPPSINVSCRGKKACLCGNAEAVKHIISQPLWRDE